MKVKFLTGIAGIKFSHKPGDVVEYADDVAKRFIANGDATEFREKEPAVSETADRNPVQSETRTTKTK